MSKSIIGLAALTLLVACSAAGAADQVNADSDATLPIQTEASMAVDAPPFETSAQLAEQGVVSCAVRAHPSARGTLIEARVEAGRSVSGDYELVITKTGGGNSSDVTQAGAFNLAAGSSTVLGQTELNLERNARVLAVLTIRDRDGEVCRHELRV